MSAKTSTLDARIAKAGNLPLFLQRRIQFREAVAEDHGNTGLSYTQKKSKRKSSEPDQSGFQAASHELFPLDRLPKMMKWDKVAPIGPGLANLGNTCFLNSVLQCLTYTPPLANYFLYGEHGRKCRVEGFCLVCELEKHVKASLGERKGGSPRVIQPTGTVGHLKWIAKHMRVGRQEDSHEFLRFIIEGMQKNFISASDASKAENRVKETTLVHQIFGGYLQSQVKCLTCNHASNTFDAFLDISLEVRQADNISKAFNQFVATERLSKVNRYRCEHCGKLSDADKSMNIYKVPNVLTIHLKRFNMTPFGEMSKINKHIEFPTELDISSFTDKKNNSSKNGNPMTSVNEGEGSSEYDLYAVLVHEGQTCNSGHYHAFVKASNDLWYSMNDSSVNQVSLATVLKQRAYILFYTKRQVHNNPIIKEQPTSAKTANPVIKREIPSPPATPDPEKQEILKSATAFIPLKQEEPKKSVPSEIRPSESALVKSKKSNSTVVAKEQSSSIPKSNLDLKSNSSLAPSSTIKESPSTSNTTAETTTIISSSMWYLSDLKSFCLSDFANLCQRIYQPSSKWIVRLLLSSK